MVNYIAALVDELYRLGIRDVVISPGSRSTPLAILFCEHNFNLYVNIDERSAGFFALGIAKEKNIPVVLVCTSGTAVAHYFPAIIEARYSRIPLIVLTADRPPELRQTGAPQTIDQIKIYGGYAAYFEELALPEDKEEMCTYARAVMQRACLSVMKKGGGAAHINIPLREPLVPDLRQLDFSIGRQKESFRLTIETSHCLKREKITPFLHEKYGIIICGGDGAADYHEEVIELAGRLKAPILADPLSNMRSYDSEFLIDSYDAFLKDERIQERLKPDYIIHFGQVPVSKRLQQFIARYKDVPYVQVDEAGEYRNPALTTQHLIVASPKHFAEQLDVENKDTCYLNQWQIYQNRMRAKLNLAKEEKSVFEGNIIQLIQEMLPDESRLVIANSMPIRDIDYFYVSTSKKIRLLCNRGANGIDGTVSTALGVSTAGHPTVLLTGDLAFYHDMNGLLIGKTHDLNLTIVLFNNNGGGIFKYLPQSQVRHFEYLFLTPHGLNFAGLEPLYGLKYYQPETKDEFIDCFKESMRQKGMKLIEIKIDLDISKRLHDRYTSPGELYAN